MQRRQFVLDQIAELGPELIESQAAGGGELDAEGREALLRYVLRPPIAQERVEQQPDGLVAQGQAPRFASP